MSHDILDAHRELIERSTTDLGFAFVDEAMHKRTRGSLAENWRPLQLAASREQANEWIAEAIEVRNLLDRGQELSLSGSGELSPHLARARKGGALELTTLSMILRTLFVARDVQRVLKQHQALLPRISLVCAIPSETESLRLELAAAIAEDGTLRDSASARLLELRKEVRVLRAKVISRLESLLLEQRELLSDSFYTLRDNRYVLPVRADAHDRVVGIVHGTSSSGATVFVEPRALIETQNRLTLAESELEIETHRILAELTVLVLERESSLVILDDSLQRLDLRCAAARLTVDIGGTLEELCEAPVVELRSAAHPALVLGSVPQVTYNDVAVESGQALILSGPNAGGKTVALKLIGVAALMARAGLPIPAKSGSKVGFFAAVMSDVGDSQSIEKSLSTFSSHLQNLRAMLAVAEYFSGKSEATLVLIDEIASGTDPGEGAALGAAVIDELIELRAAVVVTTHYELLRTRPLVHTRLKNASVGYNYETMQPTYSLTSGVPGASSALVVAERYALPTRVLQRARALVSSSAVQFEELVRVLHVAHEEVHIAKTAQENEWKAVRTLRAQLEDERHKIRARDRKALSEEGEQTRLALSQLREEVRTIERGLRRDVKSPNLDAREAGLLVSAAKDAIGRAQTQLQQSLDEIPEVEALRADIDAMNATVRVGERVFVKRLSAHFEVIEELKDGRFKVAANGVKLTLSREDLQVAPNDESKKRAPQKVVSPTAREDGALRTGTIDVRGLRAEEAIALLESELDRAYGQALDRAVIVHGVGSGALRVAVREHLKLYAPKFVSGHRPGRDEEGGDRVTVVSLTSA